VRVIRHCRNLLDGQDVEHNYEGRPLAHVATAIARKDHGRWPTHGYRGPKAATTVRDRW
jgi:hypothetical protein